MKPNLLFDFTVNKAANTVIVIREFDASLSDVWDAFTQKELLDQWWAPKPWISKTKYMYFKVGGRRFYAMCGLGGEEHWSIQEFTSIDPKTNFKFFSTFSDKNENINIEMPSSDWDLNFSEQSETTQVAFTIKQKTLADLERMIEMGFKEGFTSALNHLDKVLK